MKNRKHKNLLSKRVFGVIALISLLVFLTGCGSLDVVSKYSQESFRELMDGKARTYEEGGLRGFDVVSSEGETFGFHYLKSAEPEWGTASLELYASVDAAPFLRAGLDPDRLLSKTVYFDKATNKLIIKRPLKNLKKEELPKDGFEKMSELYKPLIKENREILGFHEALGHFGMDFGEGFAVEWAKEPKKNDKDMVWVLNPEPLVEAGLNLDSLKDWIKAKIPTMDKDGRKIQVERLIRAYNFE